uniref:Uncharacterized protein n=1 Tax=Biomphalaria glabrata TaxID=6526 RepID=A0A2C9KE60_BIOGL
MTLSKCTYTLEGDKYLFNLFYGAQVYFSDFEIKSSKISAEVFENIVQRFIKVVEEIDIKFLNHNGCASRILYALRSVYANDKQKSRSWVSMLIPLLKRSCESTVAGCCVIFSENNAVKWTEHVDIVNQVFKSFLAFQLPPSVNGDEKEKKELKEYLNILKTAVENFFNGLKKDKLIKSYGKEMMDLSLKFMNTEHEELYKLAESIAEKTELNIKEDKNAMIDAIKRFHEILKNESLPWAFCYQLYRAANHFIDKATKPFKDGKLFKNEDFEVFVSLCLTCLQYDCVHPETCSSQTGHFSIFSNITEPLFQWLQALNKMELVAPLVPELIKCFNVDEHYIINTISLYILRIGQVSSGQKVIAPYLENFIVVYLEKGNEYLLTAITQIYPSNPRLLKKHYQNFIEMLKDTGEPRLIKYLSEFFQQVSQKKKEVAAKVLADIFSNIKTNKEKIFYFLL